MGPAASRDLFREDFEGLGEVAEVVVGKAPEMELRAAGALTVFDPGGVAGNRRGFDLAFDAIAAMKPGSSSKLDLTRLVGKPDKITALKDVPGSTHGGERWQYVENGLDRLTVFLGPGVETISSFIYEVHEGDPERALKVAVTRYPGVTWQPDTVRWINPHHFPDECVLKDDASGISIEYRIERQEVNSIYRWDPSRKLAAVPPDEKPPEYCIAGGCSPAMASTEFFKRWPISEYCKVPALR